VRAGAEEESAGRSPGARPLREPAYLVLAIGFALVTIGEWGFATALAIRAYEVGGALAVGLAGARFVPAALAGVPLGSLGDRLPPGWVLAGTAALRGTAMLAAIGAIAGHAGFGVLLAVGVLDAMVGTAYRPAQARLIPALARTPSDVAGAVALLTTTKMVSQILGALLAGAVVAAFGITAAFAVVGALFAVAAVGNAAVAGRLHTRAAAASSPGLPDEQRWFAGLRVMARDANVTHVAAMAVLRSAGRGLWLALATIAALGFLGLGRSGVGILMAFSGLGVMLSIPASAALVGRPRLRRPLAIAFALCGVPLVLLALTNASTPAFAYVAIWGFGMAFADVILSVLQFRLVEAATLSRTIGTIESLKLAAEGAGALIAPALVSIVGVRTAIALAGAGPVVAVLLERRPLARADVVAGRRVARLQLLRGVPLFRSLGVEALERLAAGARRETHRAGVDVVREGDPVALDYYLIESGRAEVRLADWPVATLGPGDTFGERALLRDAPRAATVRSLTELTTYAINRDAFLAAVTGTTHEAQLARPREPDLRSLLETLRALPLVGGLEESRLNELAATGDLRTAHAGETVIREGDVGEELFIVLRGAARVERDGRTVVELLPGDHFGEIALLHDVPRSATVRATAETLLLTIGRDAYRAATGHATAAA
jgi:CRP-like cAMP-binding protein